MLPEGRELISGYLFSGQILSGRLYSLSRRPDSTIKFGSIFSFIVYFPAYTPWPGTQARICAGIGGMLYIPIKKGALTQYGSMRLDLVFAGSVRWSVYGHDRGRDKIIR